MMNMSCALCTKEKVTPSSRFTTFHFVFSYFVMPYYDFSQSKYPVDKMIEYAPGHVFSLIKLPSLVETLTLFNDTLKFVQLSAHFFSVSEKPSLYRTTRFVSSLYLKVYSLQDIIYWNNILEVYKLIHINNHVVAVILV